MQRDKDALFLKMEVTRESKDIRKAIDGVVLSHPLVRKKVEANRITLPEAQLVS